ncbi:3'-5' exonuclease [Lysobacter capsici]|uniref:3'-5' exonuclease n=1 Tax=Lysobacter capsici TaxID=435897 RepID=UPI001BFFDB43|nr:3'-5' exonuclease [Lysobacter capsici]QWF19261.1 3'-5' exonuclease [Lysobacter capsici]
MDNRNLLFYDTETTGFPLYSERSSDPRQPHMAQLGFKIVDSFTRLALDAVNVIIKPDGWTIPDEAAAVHGITTERALDEGIPERKALGMLIDAWAAVDRRVGHNEQFDARIIRIALFRFDEARVADHWKDGLAECTAELSAPIVNLPPTAKMLRAGFNKPKTPKLSEAYEFFTGRKLDGAHDAMVDVNGCEAVYWAIKDRQQAAA